jgi:hypothetical protein
MQSSGHRSMCATNSTGRSAGRGQTVVQNWRLTKRSLMTAGHFLSRSIRFGAAVASVGFYICWRGLNREGVGGLFSYTYGDLGVNKTLRLRQHLPCVVLARLTGIQPSE